jgi:hypothetical protein
MYFQDSYLVGKIAEQRMTEMAEAARMARVISEAKKGKENRLVDLLRKLFGRRAPRTRARANAYRRRRRGRSAARA